MSSQIWIIMVSTRSKKKGSKAKSAKAGPSETSFSYEGYLQMSRYLRLTWDIDKLKYEKWSKYRFKQPNV